MAAIIFDFDGTLADSFDYVADYLAGEARRGPLSAEQKQQLRGLSVGGMVLKLGFKWWQWPVLFLKGRNRMRHAIKELRSFKGIPDLAAKLQAEGHELFILSTNSNRNIKHFLHTQKMHKHFLEIYGGVGMFGKAPALRQLLKEQNIEADQAVYVGDELRDVEAAHLIGLRAVAVSWGFASRKNLKAAKPTALADTPEELFRILEEI
jgi:phosphoglycolate phosphatase